MPVRPVRLARHVGQRQALPVVDRVGSSCIAPTRKGTDFMELPTNPLPEPPDPKDAPHPLDDPVLLPGDPMLDALENSIVFPQDRADSLARHDPLLMDDLARKLDALERNIEGTGPLPQGGPPVPANAQPPESSLANPASERPESPSGSNPTVRMAPPSSQMPPGLERPNLLSPRARSSLNPARPSASRGRTNAGGGNSSLSQCPEQGDLIHKPEDCQGCPKYRHWPEGTEEEPGECWFDWEMTRWLREHNRKDRGEDGADDV